MNDKDFLLKAIEQSKESVQQGGFPAGTVIVKDGKVIATGISVGNILHDPTSHGEVNAIRNASKALESSSLDGVTIYSSLEPCMMCLGASMWARVSRIVFACGKPSVSSEYYGGDYTSLEINKVFAQPIEIVHFKELENSALEIVHEWESSLS